jgi:hypothetical protein
MEKEQKATERGRRRSDSAVNQHAFENEAELCRERFIIQRKLHV